MITNSYYTYDFRGTSRDDKSLIENPTNGSTYFEMDTCKVFMYDAENHQWKELSL